jgi:two-component system response regulator HydG
LATVLVVEDEPLSRFALSGSLRDAGYFVEEAASGEAALELLKTKTFDAVIADFKLKGRVNGLEVLTAFERVTPGRAKILMTAYLPKEIGAESVGAVHVSKPVDLEDLLKKLKSILP